MWGAIEVEVPRDRDGSFEPAIVRKRQRRLGGIDGIVLSLSAKGLTHGEIAAHLAEIYNTQVSKQTVTTITESWTAWPNGRTGPSTRCIRWSSWTR